LWTSVASVVARILRHLNLATGLPDLRAARATAAGQGCRLATECSGDATI
jgi:hypothetical protein